MNIEVVCFDIDGTLYPKWVTNWKLMGSFFPSPSLALRYQRFRRLVRKDLVTQTEPENREGFRLRQAAWLSGVTSSEEDPGRVGMMKDRVEHQFYENWRCSFAKLTPFSGVRESFVRIKELGGRISVLSDFPIEGKLDALEIADLVDFSCCAEDSGYLKPHPAPFRYVAQQMGVDCDRILFVGDSCRKDIVGASDVGMKTCLFAPRARSSFTHDRLRSRCPRADLICSDYRDFLERMVDIFQGGGR